MPDFTSIKVYVLNFYDDAPLYFKTKNARDHHAECCKWRKSWKAEMEVCLPHLVEIIKRGDFIDA